MHNADRFLRHVLMCPMSGCWLWTGDLDKDGYGNFHRTRPEARALGLKGRSRRAHRASWEIHRGAIPDGFCVLHHCDNRACVNPDHLYTGTDADNVRDMDARGRRVHGDRVGEANANCRLSDDDVRAIRETYGRGGITQTALAKSYGVNQTQISQIVLRKQRTNV